MALPLLEIIRIGNSATRIPVILSKAKDLIEGAKYRMTICSNIK